MKSKWMVGALSVTVVVAIGAFMASAKERFVEKKDVVIQFLMNPEGDVDGLILRDGTQVHFPPHLSKEVREIVQLKDEIQVKGVPEGAKVFRAEKITNTKTSQVVEHRPPSPPLAGTGGPPPPGPGARRALTDLKAEGKIESQLFGPRGDVNGVVLSGGTIVRVGPRVKDQSSVSLEVGKNLRASGFGTKNEIGESLEATELKNF